MIDQRFKRYRKKSTQLMRPYEDGEDMSGISVSDEDVPQKYGMIAVNEKNADDQWYVSHLFFSEHYEEV